MSEADTTSTEQAADLAALQTAAADGQVTTVAAGPAGQGAPSEPQPPSEAALQVAALAVGMLRPLIEYAVPALRGAPDELWKPVPEGAAALLDHYGVNADWMQSPWAKFAFSLAPLAAFAAVKAMEEKPKAKPQSIAGPDLSATPVQDTAGSKAVTIGTAMPAEPVAA